MFLQTLCTLRAVYSWDTNPLLINRAKHMQIQEAMALTPAALATSSVLVQTPGESKPQAVITPPPKCGNRISFTESLNILMQQPNSSIAVFSAFLQDVGHISENDE